MKDCYIKISLAAVLALSLAVAALALAPGESAPDFRLTDQFGKTWSLSGQRGNITVVVAATQKSGRAMGPWVDNIKSRFSGRAQTLGLLDLHTVPGMFRGVARSRIRKETSDPLMIDFDGAIARKYGAADKAPAVAVIDKAGRIAAVHQGDYSPEAFERIAQAVEAAMGR